MIKIGTYIGKHTTQSLSLTTKKGTAFLAMPFFVVSMSLLTMHDFGIITHNNIINLSRKHT